MDAIHIVLADDHPIVNAGMHILAEARHLVEDLAPDILLLEMALAVEPEPLSTQQVISGPTRVFALRGYHNHAYVFGLLASGSTDELTEHNALQMIADAIYARQSGEIGGRSQRIEAKWPTDRLEAAQAAMPDLTPREREVLAQLSRGGSDQAISQQLGISKRTVRYHLQNIYSKLGIRHRSEAIVWAVRAGLGE
jgi:DNA-binding NarL/FixJ family response regulator